MRTVPLRNIRKYLKPNQDLDSRQIGNKIRSLKLKWDKGVVNQGPTYNYEKESWEIQALNHLLQCKLSDHSECSLTSKTSSIIQRHRKTSYEN